MNDQLNISTYTPLAEPTAISEQLWPEGTVPIVSTATLTYNHELYIRECLDGILMQKTTFPVLITIFEDCSTDSTASIIKEYEKKYPQLFFVSYQPENTWMKTIRKEALKPYLDARKLAKYTAFCEGDDYWTDPLKLQKQVSFLEANPDYSLVFHNAEVHNTLKSEKKLFIKNYDSSEYTAFDIFATWLIPTASMVFRNVLSPKRPEFMVKATHGDLALQVYLNDFGKFHAINEVMSVYRINQSSVTINSFSGLKHNMAHVHQLKLMNTFFKKKYDVPIKRRIFLYYLKNANQYKRESVLKPIYWIIRAFFINPSLIFYYKKRFKNSLKAVIYTSLVFLKLKK